MKNIRIVLINTSHPGNIGASARALKTMDLQELCLVNPKLFPHIKATTRAAQAVDVLEQAKVVNSLDEAIGDCGLVLGTSARERALAWPILTAHEAGKLVLQESLRHPVAILFGNERTGLVNEELQRCQYQIEIPSNPAYSSLNLAAAVQVIAYEIRQAFLAEKGIKKENILEDELATDADLQGFYQHLTTVLQASEFLDPEQPKQAMGRLKRLFNRSRLDKTEINILRGILTSIQRKFHFDK